MARIYNCMPFDIAVSATLLFFPEGSTTIATGQRSESLDWSSATAVSVVAASTSERVCSFDFGIHAQIQGGNYAIIGPTTFVVYDSNHEVICSSG